MTPRQYLQVKTRDPRFLLRLTAGILLAGIGLGLGVDWLCGPTPLERWYAAQPTDKEWLNPLAPRDPRQREEPEDEEFGQGPNEDRPKLPKEFRPEPLAPSYKLAEEAAAHGDWAHVARCIIAALGERWSHAGPAVLAVFTGVAWLAFLLQSAQPRSKLDIRLTAPIVGIALGLLSGPLTMLFIFWQEAKWGIVESRELVPGLRFYILGVGFREELAKFLCFAPLLPWLSRRGDQLAALAAAGAVGLGFAVEENLDYIWGSQGMGTVARLLMPAPFHMAATGLIGLAAYRACQWPRDWTIPALATFATVVFAHGLYDAFFSLTALADYGLASYVVFIVLVRQLFVEMRPLQHTRPAPVSLTANFLTCVSLVAAATFVYLCAVVGWRPAVDMLAGAMLAESAMVYMFLREMPERIIPV